MDSGLPQSLPHRCGRCGSRWAGSNTCHCGSCCVTLTSPSTFDSHRRDGQCRPPADVGMVAFDRAGYVAWGYPADEAAVERLRAIRETR